MGAVASFVEDVVGGVVDAVGDVVEAVGDVVEKAVETVGNVVEAVIENPLPVLASVAGAMIGIPPPVTMAAITAAQGGDLEDIALSAGLSYLAPVGTNAISSTLTEAIGDSFINETVSNAVVDGVSKGLVNGTIAEVKGGDFEDGFAGGFTGGMVGAGVTEVSDFVKPDVMEAMTDAGFDESTVNDIMKAGSRALTAGVTSEVTGRGDFATSFTNSLVNSGANAAANSITDQFTQTITTDQQIAGSQEGNKEDQDLLLTELDDDWAKTTGAVGTGAGIPDEIVDQVQVSDIGQETPSTQEDPLMVESMSQDSLDTGIDGYGSSDSLQAEAEKTVPVEDVSDLASGYGVEMPAPTITEAQQEPTAPLYQEEPLIGEDVAAQAGQEMPLAPKAQPLGGLAAVAPAPDVYDEITSPLVKPQTEDSVVDVAGEQGIGMKAPVVGGLAAGLMPTQGGQSALTGALNQILRPAIRQGITQTLRGTPSRPVVKRPPPQTQARVAPARMTPAQLAAMRQPTQTQSVAPKQAPARVAPPKKRDVATLTPVTNIAGLTSLLKSKG